MALLDGQPMVDAAWLYRAPLYQGSLQWSEDNLIAVAGGPSVTILSPSNLNGPRGHLTIQPSPGPVAMGCQPQDRDASLALKISCLEDASRQVTRGNPDSYQARPAAVRALSWSPMGASSTGGCLLAVLTDDQQVLVYSAPSGSAQAEWQEQASVQLQQRLLTHMAATKWQDVDVPSQPGDDGAPLRLRGGGSGKRPRGWRKATLPGGAAAGTPPAAEGAAGRGATGRGAAGRGAAGRGAAGRGAASRGARGRGAAGRGAAAGAAAAADDGEEAAAAGPPGKRRRKNAAQAAQQQQQEDVKEDEAASGAGQPEGLAQSPASDVAVGSVVEVTNDEDGLQGAWWRGDVLDIQAGFALVRYQELDADEATGTKLEEWFRLPWLISGEEGAAAAPALQPPAPWHVAEGFRIRPVPPEEACAFPAPPAVGDDLEVDHDDTLWHTRVLGVTPDGVYHVAEPGYIGTALEVGLEQLRPSLRWDWETGAWHRVQYPAGQEAPSPAGSASARAGPSGAGGAGKAPGAKEGGDAGSTTKGKGKKGASKPAAAGAPGEEVWEPEDYLVPADFDMQVFLSMLPGNAVLGKGPHIWKKAGPRLLLSRFIELRQTLTPQQVPVYTKGAHLRNHDLRLFQQALAEFKFCFGAAALEQPGGPAASEAADEGEGRITEKELVKAAKASIRQKVVQSFSPYVRQDSAAPYLTKGYTPRGRPPAAAGAAGAGGRAPVGQPAGGAAQGDGVMEHNASLTSELGSPTTVNQPLAAGGGEAGQEEPRAAARGFVLEGRQGVHGAVASLLIEEEGGPALKIDWAAAGPKEASMASLGGVLQGSKVPTGVWEERRRFLMQTSIAWAPCCHLEAPAAEAGSRGRQQAADSAAVSLLAVGTQSGHVVLWRQQHPPSYALQEQQLPGSLWSCLGAAKVTAGRVTCLSWCVAPAGPTSSTAIQQVTDACARSPEGSAAQVAAGAVAGATAALPGDHLLLAVGSSAADTKLWVVDPTATTAGAALQCLGILAPPSARSAPPPLCIDLAVVVDAAASVAGAAPDRRPSPSARLMVASGSGMGAVSAWTSAGFTLAGASRQDLAAAIAGGRAAAAQAHAAGKVTGVVVNPWGPGVASSGEDGRICHSKLVDGRLELQPGPDRFNPHAAPQRTPCLLNYTQRADAPFQGLAASGNRLVLLGVRVFQADAQQVQQQEEGEGQTGAASQRQNFHRIAKAGLQMSALYGRHPDLQQQLHATVLPRVLGCSVTQLLRSDGALAAAAFWDVAACMVSGGWRRLAKQLLLPAPPQDGSSDPQQQQGEDLMLVDVPAQGGGAVAVSRKELPDVETEEQQRLERAAQRLKQLRAAEWDMLQQLLQLLGRALVAADPGPGYSNGSSSSSRSDGSVAAAACKLASGLCSALLHLWQSMRCEGAEVPEEQLQQLQSAAEQRELQLLQQHVASCLQLHTGVCYCLQPCTTTARGAPGKGAASSPTTTAAAAAWLQASSSKLLQLSRLLLADWVVLQAQWLGPGAQQLLAAAAQVYHQAGAVPAEGEQAPAREANPFGGSLPQLRMVGGPLVSAKVAVVPMVAGGEGSRGDTGAGVEEDAGGTSIVLPRCAASGLVCPVDGNTWWCGVCARRYSAPPVRGRHGLVGVARCLFCGVRLAAGSRGPMVMAPAALPGPPIIQQQRRTV